MASVFGMRLRIALAEKEVQYEYTEQDLGNKSPLLLHMNPIHKKVPVLIHNGNPVCESLIALKYINDVWNDKAPLLSSDPYLKSQARFWASFIDNKVHEFGRNIWRTKGAEQEAAKKDFLDSIKLLEGELGDRSNFGGETLGFDDVALIPLYSWFSVYEKRGNFSIEAECPKLIAWAQRCFFFFLAKSNFIKQRKLLHEEDPNRNFQGKHKEQTKTLKRSKETNTHETQQASTRQAHLLDQPKENAPMNKNQGRAARNQEEYNIRRQHISTQSSDH